MRVDKDEFSSGKVDPVIGQVQERGVVKVGVRLLQIKDEQDRFETCFISCTMTGLEAGLVKHCTMECYATPIRGK